jgi:RHH-type proline utilization regulon transcriptional repressor/proline dehydrogenase/delta 1-pyrroline-5-carboxylate dehydrogenase
VLWSVPQRLQRSAAALLEEWQAGGLALGAVRLEAVIVGRTLAELAASPEIDRAVVLGDRAAARELARRRPDLRVEGRFHARGAILVTPAADLDRAVTDIVASGFRAAGSDPRAAHAVILLGSTARSRRFRDALADAVRALRVGDTARPGSARLRPRPAAGPARRGRAAGAHPAGAR